MSALRCIFSLRQYSYLHIANRLAFGIVLVSSAS